MDSSKQELERAFEKFKQKVDENTRELTEKVQEERDLEQEILTKEKEIREAKAKIAHLKPKISELEREKIKTHQELQHIEMENRAHINEHLVDKSKMIKPLHS